MIGGYDPDRVAELEFAARSALEHLDRIVSADPAASAALDATRRLGAVLSAALAPAIASLRVSDPLGRAAPRRAGVAGLDWYADWVRSTIETARRTNGDDELLAELERLELDVPYDDEFQPDLADPFWHDFRGLAIELAVRAEADEGFAQRLVDRAAGSFLIPIAVRFARFDPEVVAGMLREVARSPSAVDDLLSAYQAFGADCVLSTLIEFPAVALEVLATSGSALLKELIEWPFLDPDVVDGFLDAAMSVPFSHESRLGDAHAVLQHLVTLANRKLHETGFPDPISPTIAKIVVQYLPFFVTSLNGHGDVHLKDFDFRDAGVRLGSYEEVLDLFGALLRDPASLDIVLASVPGIALIGAGDNGPLGITPDDMADLVAAINRAALNEQLEERLKTARAERNARLAIDIVFGAFELVRLVTGPVNIGGTEVPLDLLKRGTVAIVDWAITDTDLALDDVANLTFLLVVFGLSIGVLRSRSERDEDAEDIVREIEERTAAGATVDDLEGLINDLGRVARGLDDTGVLDVLDDPRVRPPDLDVHDTADLGE